MEYVSHANSRMYTHSEQETPAPTLAGVQSFTVSMSASMSTCMPAFVWACVHTKIPPAHTHLWNLCILLRTSLSKHWGFSGKKKKTCVKLCQFSKKQKIICPASQPRSSFFLVLPLPLKLCRVMDPRLEDVQNCSGKPRNRRGQEERLWNHKRVRVGWKDKNKDKV